jgi:hypothetical protein
MLRFYRYLERVFCKLNLTPTAFAGDERMILGSEERTAPALDSTKTAYVIDEDAMSEEDEEDLDAVD